MQKKYKNRTLRTLQVQSEISELLAERINMTPEEFISRWQRSGGAELANSQSFLKELCLVLGVPEPEPTQADESLNTYVFEKAVNLNNGDGTSSTGRVDLYRQKTFVLESKQGAERRAKELAEALATVTQQQRHRKGTATARNGPMGSGDACGLSAG